MRRGGFFTRPWWGNVVVLLGGLSLTSAQAQADEALSLEHRIEQLEQQLENAVDAMGESHNTRAKKTSFGGYGELHYNNLRNEGPGDDKKELDFHRFVIFVGHTFTDRIKFFSETELEHAIAGEGQVGEVELEQAFIDFTIVDAHGLRAGIFLVPVGILNETHEPPTFYGVERNPVEKSIVPSTWWEGGVNFYGYLAPGLQYDFVISSGLNNASYNIRSGRQKVGKAEARDLAYTGRLNWNVNPGVQLAATAQWQSNITQGADPDASAVLLQAHGVFSRGPFAVKALYATWDVAGDGAEAVGKDEQGGWYVESSFKVSKAVGLFARYNFWDNTAGDDSDSEYQQIDAGVNYWPHENVVVKLDFQDQSVPSGQNEFDGLNLGIGFQF